jgi:hypothetical protein
MTFSKQMIERATTTIQIVKNWSVGIEILRMKTNITALAKDCVDDYNQLVLY